MLRMKLPFPNVIDIGDNRHEALDYPDLPFLIFDLLIVDLWCMTEHFELIPPYLENVKTFDQEDEEDSDNYARTTFPQATLSSQMAQIPEQRPDTEDIFSTTVTSSSNTNNQRRKGTGTSVHSDAVTTHNATSKSNSASNIYETPVSSKRGKSNYSRYESFKITKNIISFFINSNKKSNNHTFQKLWTG